MKLAPPGWSWTDFAVVVGVVLGLFVGCFALARLL